MSETIESMPAEAPPSGPLLRFWRHPITQMLAKIVFFLLVAALLGYLLHKLIVLPSHAAEADPMAAAMSETGAAPWLRQLRSLLPLAIAYWLMVRVVERRKVSEFAPRKAPLHLATGWLTGMAIMVAAAGALSLPGYYSVAGTNAGVALLTPFLVLGVQPGVGEEIISRGILFRVVEECFGSWAAVVFSGALFGLAHIANPNSSVWMALAIAVEAGFLLGMAYAWTRSMWFVVALHAAWNFTQGPLLGIPVSGISLTGLLNSTLQGPPALSGGRFGAEGSLITVLICVALGVFFAHRAIKAGRIVPPYWRRRLPGGGIALPRFEAGAPGLRSP